MGALSAGLVPAVLPAVLALFVAAQEADRSASLFAFLAPTVRLTVEERQQLEAGSVVASTLPARGHVLALLAAGAVHVDPNTFIARINRIAELEKSSMVPEIGRFSEPPSLEDLSALTLDEVDFDAIRQCQPGHCDLKLSTAEIERLQEGMAGAGGNWRSATQQEFRRLVFNRVIAYLRLGQPGIPQYTAHPEDLGAIFGELIEQSPYLQSKAPRLAATLQRYPFVKPAGIETFLYWSKEKPWRDPIISVTQVHIARGDGAPGSPEVVVASKELFATRASSGSLSVTVLTASAAGSSRQYMVWVNRTWVDELHFIWRPFVEHFARSKAPGVFAATRDRIQGVAGRAPQ